jgi:hypothetical protein
MTKLALAAALVLASSSAFALEGHDGDNNPLPGASRAQVQTVAPAAYAQARGIAIRSAAPKGFSAEEKALFERAQGLAE